MLPSAMPARRQPGRPTVGPHPLTASERKARSRKVVRPDVVQLNVEVAAEVRDTLRDLAGRLGKSQAEVVADALRRYAARRR